MLKEVDTYISTTLGYAGPGGRVLPPIFNFLATADPIIPINDFTRAIPHLSFSASTARNATDSGTKIRFGSVERA